MEKKDPFPYPPDLVAETGAGYLIRYSTIPGFVFFGFFFFSVCDEDQEP